nr:hypothetical protein [Tanacetum cinerariifolium]
NQIGDLSTHTTSYISPALTQKVFANMRRVGKGFSGVETPLFEDTCFALTHHVENLEHDKVAQKLEIIKLKARVKRLEKANKVKSSKLRRLKKVGTSQRVVSSDDMEDVFNQGRMIDDLDKDEGIELVVDQINKDIDWDAAIDHVKQKSKENPQYIKRYQVMKKRPQTESEARKNMTIYLKNTAGYKLDFFKGMSYNEICPIFQARFDANMRFLFMSREEMEEEDQEVLKSINETPAQKAAKRRKLNEEAQKA